jgi:tetraacyldisaccharide 4'-kinase
MKKHVMWRRLLVPLNPLYRLGLGLRDLRLMLGLEPVRRLEFPVVSIGNLSTGGSGKTPLTIALAKALSGRGLQVDVLSRGYGRQSQLAARVKSDGTAAEFGDEPLLMAREAGVPVYVGARRFEAGTLAEAEQKKLRRKAKPALEAQAAEVQGSEASPSSNPFANPESTAAQTVAPSVHLLDDGFQHRQLAREVDILLMDRRDWQDWLLPAGNLREPRHAANRATVIALPSGDKELERAVRLWGWQGPVWTLRRRMEVPAVSGPVAAFCGIARPEQFFQGLEAQGQLLAARFAFPDHFHYTPLVLENLVTEARDAGATALVTTEKDLVRLGKLAASLQKSMPLVTARLTVEIEDEGTAMDWLVDRITPRPANQPL